jgi:hypothetical protein
MASKTKNINRYADCRLVLELADRGGFAKKFFVGKGGAIHFRQRVYQFRALYTDFLADSYRRNPATFEKAGTSPFDDLRCRIVELDPPVKIVNATVVDDVSGKYVPDAETYYWAVEITRERDTPVQDVHGNIVKPENDEPEEGLLG